MAGTIKETRLVFKKQLASENIMGTFMFNPVASTNSLGNYLKI